MSLKLRLTVAVVAILAVVTGVLGYAVVAVNRAAALDRIDARLQGFVDNPGALRPGALGAAPGTDDDRPGAGEISTVAYAWSVPQQAWIPLLPTVGPFRTSPPALPLPNSTEFLALSTAPQTLRSSDGTTQYRVRTTVDRAGRSRAAATSLQDLQSTDRSLVGIVIVAGLLALVAGGLVSWWVIRRALRPVDRMIEAAAAIADGDLSQRIEHTDDGTELGTLGAALDDMLVQLETDIEERERASARLRQFVADASHELRTPVAAIRGYSELFLAGGVPDGEPADRAMRRIETESRRMGTLIEELLLLARLDQDRPLELVPTDIGSIVLDSVAAFGVIHPHRGVAVNVASDVIVDGDATRLRQVSDNLLGNAIAHTPSDTAIAVSVAADGDVARVSVVDHGPGIPAEQRSAVFGRFTRLDDSRTRDTGGVGLGLSIVAAILRAHGGRVALSETAGGGTTVLVEIPLVSGPARP